MKPFIFLYLSSIFLLFPGCRTDDNPTVSSILKFEKKGLAVSTTDITTEIPENDSVLFPDFTIMAIDIQDDGSVWFYANVPDSSFLVQYTGQKAFLYTFPGYPGGCPYLREICHNANGHIFFSGFRGLMEYDKTGFNQYLAEDTPINELRAISVCTDRGNNIWFSLNDVKKGGVVKTDLKTWQYFTPENTPMPNRLIRNIEVDAINRVWMTNNDYVGDGAIVQYSQGTWKVYPLALYYIINLTINTRNHVFAFIDYGLSSINSHPEGPFVMEYDDSAWKNILTCDSLVAKDCINISFAGITSDRNGNIWIVLIGHETSDTYTLYRYDGVRWLKIKNLNCTVFCMEEYPDGSIWLGTSGGIIKFKPASTIM